jgi:hypothetical protein
LAELGRLWAGSLFGTNTGRLALELESAVADGHESRGVLRVSDDNFGVAIYSVCVKFDGAKLIVEGMPQSQVEGLAQGKISAEAALQPNGHLSGQWSSDIGTGGAFQLFPHLGAVVPPDEKQPEQIYTTNKDLGALRLYRIDLADIISVLRRKFPDSKIVVTHIDRGAELMLYSDDFEEKLNALDHLNWIKLNVQAAAGGGFSKSLTIDLGQSFNRVTTQGPDESWVLGEAEATASMLRAKQSRLSTAIGKYRVNVNQLIFVAALVAMPDLNLRDRAIFMVAVIALILLANKLTQTLVPNFDLDLKGERPSLVAQIWPSALSWLISATAGIAASLVYGLLQH